MTHSDIDGQLLESLKSQMEAKDAAIAELRGALERMLRISEESADLLRGMSHNGAPALRVRQMSEANPPPD